MIQVFKRFGFAAALAGCLLTGCSKHFLNDNIDPNRVTTDNITAELIFPAVAESVGAANVGARATGAGATSGQQFVQNWIGYMASNGAFTPDATQVSYNISFGFSDPEWTARYALLFNLHQAEVKGLTGGDTSLAGAAIILSAKITQEVVDLFGDIPYSQAFQAGSNTHPAYDKAAAIYQSLQLRLDTAIRYMGLPVTKLFTNVDIVNHGDGTKWIKLANTLKLRLLIRQSEVQGFNPSAEIAKIFSASGPGILGAGESVNENPGYSNDVLKQSPFYANYGYDPAGNAATSVFQANDYIVTILSNDADPRLGEFFSPNAATGTFVGDVFGDNVGNIPDAKNSSYFGPRLIASPAQDQWILPSYESLFFRAEAAARGWISDDPQQAYMNAVTESFVWTNVSTAATEAAKYMNNNADANWANAGTSVASRVRFIAFQKYIANTCIDPLESYADQRRLNFLPAGYISLDPARVSSTLPLRMLYPQSEYTTNAANVQAEGTIDAFKTKLFWEP